MQRFEANGYEITATENEIIFIDRKTWGLGLLMAVLGMVATILVVLSGLTAAGVATEIRPDVARVVLPVAAALLLIGIWISGRAYRRRRDQPTEEIRDTLIVDRSCQLFRGRMGEILAQLSDVKARMHIDWWTRGTMRIVALSWPGGRRTVYRTFGRRRCLDLLEFLNEQGLDAQ